jgi:hypothetical protein
VHAPVSAFASSAVADLLLLLPRDSGHGGGGAVGVHGDIFSVTFPGWWWAFHQKKKRMVVGEEMKKNKVDGGDGRAIR